MRSKVMTKTTIYLSEEYRDKLATIEKYFASQKANFGKLNHSRVFALIVDAFTKLFIESKESNYQKQLNLLTNREATLTSTVTSKISRTLDIVDPIYYLLVVALQKQFDVTWQLNRQLSLEEQISPEVQQILELVFMQIKADRIRGKTIKESHKGR